MLTSYAVGMIAVALLGCGWVAVQAAWRRSFHGACDDPDALAGRMGCHGCGEAPTCERRRAQRNDPRWEENA